MAIGNKLIFEWIDRIAAVQDLQMDPVTLADDVLIMGIVFSDEIYFQQAMDSILRALNQLVQRKVTTSQLVSNYNGWHSYHFQSQRTQGNRSNLRIVFQRPASGLIRVRGFSHRFLPADIYDRLKSR